jgi:hypothetical protein
LEFFSAEFFQKQSEPFDPASLRVKRRTQYWLQLVAAAHRRSPGDAYVLVHQLVAGAMGKIDEQNDSHVAWTPVSSE